MKNNVKQKDGLATLCLKVVNELEKLNFPEFTDYLIGEFLGENLQYKSISKEMIEMSFSPRCLKAFDILESLIKCYENHKNRCQR